MLRSGTLLYNAILSVLSSGTLFSNAALKGFTLWNTVLPRCSKASYVEHGSKTVLEQCFKAPYVPEHCSATLF